MVSAVFHGPMETSATTPAKPALRPAAASAVATPAAAPTTSRTGARFDGAEWAQRTVPPILGLLLLVGLWYLVSVSTGSSAHRRS